jgi:hypothetical protein
MVRRSHLVLEAWAVDDLASGIDKGNSAVHHTPVLTSAAAPEAIRRVCHDNYVTRHAIIPDAQAYVQKSGTAIVSMAVITQ